jgi:hypothetical protein
MADINLKTLYRLRDEIQKAIDEAEKKQPPVNPSKKMTQKEMQRHFAKKHGLQDFVKF